MKKLVLLTLTLALALGASDAYAKRDSSSLGMDGALSANIDQGDTGTPIGTVIAWPHKKLPEGGYWAFCDGSKAPAEYVAATGSSYLPDYRGVVLRGYKATEKGVSSGSGKSSLSKSIDKNVNKSQSLGSFEANNLGEHRHVVGKSSNQWGYDSGGYGAWLPYYGHSSDSQRNVLGTMLNHHNVWTGCESYDVVLSGKAIPFDEKTQTVLAEAGREQMPANVTVNYIVKVR